MQLPGVFRHRDYALLWLGQLVSNLGDSFQTLALAWLVKERSGSSLLVGGVLASYLVPMVVLGPVAGVITDQFSKRKLMIVADLVRMTLVALVAVLHGLGVLQVWEVFVVAVVMGAANALFDPARQGSLPLLVNADELAQANSFALLTRQMSQLVGPVLAGLVIAKWGVAPAFWGNAASFAVSAFFLWLMRFRSAMREAHRSVEGVWGDLKTGLATVGRDPTLRLILPIGMAVNFLLGPVPVLLPVYTAHLSKLGAVALGYLQSTTGVGMLLGSIIAGITAKRWAKGHMAIAGLTCAGLAIGGLGLAEGLQQAQAALGVFGISMVLVNVPIMTLIQRDTPVEQQGRVFGVFMSATTASQPLAMALGGWLGDAVGIRAVYVSIGILFTLLSLGVAATPSLRDVP